MATTQAHYVLLPLSTVDASIHIFELPGLYIFPPPKSSEISYDLNQLQRSFVTLVDEDYPIFIVELHIDPSSGTVSVKQTPGARQQGGAGIRFETNPESSMTTEQAMETLSWEFIPSERDLTELIRLKGTLLSDGGLAIGLRATHSLFDGEAMFTFMKMWGHHYNGIVKENRVVVNHDRHWLSGTGAPSMWPHAEFSHMMRKIMEVTTYGHSSEIIATDAETMKPPSYVSTNDAITALFTVSMTRAQGHDQDVRAVTMVNARRRLQPPLPDNYSGNAAFYSMSAHENGELLSESNQDGGVSPNTLAKVTRRIRASIPKHDDAYLRDAVNFLAEQKNVSSIQPGSNFLFGHDVILTSWLHMGMHDADFAGTHPWYSGFLRSQSMGLSTSRKLLKTMLGLMSVSFLIVRPWRSSRSSILGYHTFTSRERLDRVLGSKLDWTSNHNDVISRSKKL
ncbi:Shikimate O-hydroxycinnamoyltransferase [Phytophthora cinnamomi]|uniref:Shikimate O-hydroxycinnamoyltransferase n=1 Tax=Phytophthora cinnamomi TaxID=4785 RepID=UPI00355946B4|nr:Shikimate O-hydroxycinnamoyltransferase [Phytophthora cinnamomi]